MIQLVWQCECDQSVTEWVRMHDDHDHFWPSVIQYHYQYQSIIFTQSPYHSTVTVTVSVTSSMFILKCFSVCLGGILDVHWDIVIEPLQLSRLHFSLFSIFREIYSFVPCNVVSWWWKWHKLDSELARLESSTF